MDNNLRWFIKQLIKKELYPKDIKFWKFSVSSYFPDFSFQMLEVLFILKFKIIVIFFAGKCKAL